MDIIPILRSVGLSLSRKRKAARRRCLQGLVSTSPPKGRKHLGAALGSRSYLEQYLGGKVEDMGGRSDEVGGVCKFSATS